MKRIRALGHLIFWCFAVIESLEYNELVEQSLKGDKDALSMLAEAIYESLRSYVFRITLSEGLTDDIVQETILEMYKIFGQLRESDRFWPWLCKIALNKVRMHSNTHTRRRGLLQKHSGELSLKSHNLEGLAHVINEEIKQAIFDAMSRLTYQQKAVLSMRCYQDMPYSQIAEIMGVSELSGRLLFHRAKKRLQKQLFKSGFGRKSLLAAIIIFGKMSAPNEAAAAQICVNSSMLGVGALATTVASVTTKTALALSAGGIITLGLITNASLNKHNDIMQPQNPQKQVVIQGVSVAQGQTDVEGYYYYPTGSDGPVMMRLAVSTGKTSYKVLQNDKGNYFFGNKGQNVKIHNYHYWKPDMSVMVLPTDSPRLEAFLSKIENREADFRRNFSAIKDLLIVTSKQKETNKITFSAQNYDALMEERFQYNWPAVSIVIDERDSIHQQGWCYFIMEGNFKNREINGFGLIPFKHPVSQIKPQWFFLKIDSGVELFDSSKGAAMKDSNGSITSYPANTFLAGLNKPWLGLHCIDTVRRDAALNGIAFRTELLSGKTLCKVSLLHSKGTIEYTIDLYTDLIKEISFIDESGSLCGEILFEYTKTIPAGYENFRMPALRKYSSSTTQKPIHWLGELVSGNL